jgi:transcriptional regulator NrdR family protein
MDKRLTSRVKPSGWKCSICGGSVKIIDTRRYDDRITRRRACIECGFRVSTKEVICSTK